MNRKKFWAIIAGFVVYCVLLGIISINHKTNDTTPEAETTVEKAENAEQSDVAETVPTENVPKETVLTETIPNETVSAETASTERLTEPVSLLSPDAFAAADIEGKAEVDTPWKSNIELLGADQSEQGLFMMPGTAITFTTPIPADAKLEMTSKIYDSIAELGVSDGVTLIVEVIQDGRSLIMYDPIVVSGDGQENMAELNLTEWQGRTIEMRIHCYDGGNDDAVGDWVVIKSLELTSA